ncbi:4-hydroxythreonine-4-phosphate dehydrogenase PdxA [Acidaminobacter hydrogenoformans]|uniref:4-hydroxythreonine-4-phosphate dehydrogenase n=1 Tax=Acidaminobacter hydrogenoformans DSM 2784 TaxID=1120920 RepID=A0A1G5RVP1_9FIRM|nr:4-hydroxythreonine-4-phosphate dehydrogenase PdxA [Acidaminobacter hydrogenoformans]SCZ78184.1 4-hydroxythreonine-4-phosphate dehydrogenase [Acidaminobacter hydrogenoformans DSM 2784]
MKPRPILALTMGDPCGVGAEIAVKALANKAFYDQARPLVIGDLTRLEYCFKFVELPLKLNVIRSPEEGRFEFGTIDVLHMEVPGVSSLGYGKVDAVAGEAAVTYVLKGIELAKAREVDAVVTGPLNKEAIHLAGHHFPGHTEIFAQMTDTEDYAMMLFADGLHTIHVSTHCSLRQACDRATQKRVGVVIRLAKEVIELSGLENKKIAVAGLNPHSGENGAFGTEEIQEIIPAIEAARIEDPATTIIGPVPPDSLFVRAKAGEYQVMVVMYHDQGHIPMKIINFDEGVNVTLGLPIIRTSVDHGTAFGRAGQGRASANSMEAAMRLAITMAENKFYNSGGDL